MWDSASAGRTVCAPRAPRARHVQQGAAGRAAGEDERPQRGEVLVVAVAGGLEGLDVRRLHAQGRELGVGHDRGAQVGADVEELVLDPREQGPDVVGEAAEGQGDAEGGVGLVGVGVGLQAEVVLAHPGHVAEGRGAVVAGARVDAGEIDHAPSLRPPGTPGRAARRPSRVA